MKRFVWGMLMTTIVCGPSLLPESANGVSIETHSNPVANGAITIDSDRSDWQGIPEYMPDVDTVPPGPELDFDVVQFANDAANIYFRLQLLPSPSGEPQPFGFRHNLFIDADQNRDTGFVGAGGFLAIGADFLVQGPALFSFSGATSETWGWDFVQDLTANDTPDTDIEAAIPIAALGNPELFDFFFNAANEGFVAEDFYPSFVNSPLGDFFTYEVAMVPGSGIAGDFNGNGMVEQADLDLVLLNWGQDGTTPPAGWVNDLPIGNIDQEELDSVLLNWGNSATSTPVPEPTGLMLLLFGAGSGMALVGRRRTGKAASRRPA